MQRFLPTLTGTNSFQIEENIPRRPTLLDQPVTKGQRFEIVLARMRNE